MVALSPEQRAYFEKLIGEYEQMREDAQNGLKATVGDLREKLGQLVAKEDLADEVAGFRLFVKRRWDAKNHPEKVAKVDDKTEIADAYEFQASRDQVYTTRTHSAGRAKLAPQNPQVQTPHDADGVVIEQSPTASEEVSASRDVVEGAEPASRNQPDISAEVERSTAADGSSASNSGDIADTKSCGSTLAGKDQGDGCETLVLEPVGSTPNGAGRIDNPAMGMALRSSAVSDDRPLAGSLSSNQDPHHNVEMSGLPGPQDTPSPIINTPLPVSTVTGKTSEPFQPDPSNKWLKNVGAEPEMPAFLNRATTDQVGRA